jgi:hypothetical protein
MLEIIALVALCRHNSRILKEVGASAWPFVVLTIVMWFGFEMFGALVAAIVTYDPKNPHAGLNVSVYVAGILSAGVGALLSVLITKWRVASVRRAQQDEELMRPTPMA